MPAQKTDGYSRQKIDDGRISVLAEHQGGHVSRTQLHALGLSHHAIAWRVRRRLLIRVYHGVYAVGHRPAQPLDRVWGALLAAGEGSALADGSAGSYWAIYSTWWEPLELVALSPHDIRGLRIRHCPNALIHTDRLTQVRVTTAAQTALDLAPRMFDRRAGRMVRDLRVRRKLTNDQLHAVLAANPEHPGAPRLIRIVAGSQREPTRSDLEDAFLAIVRRFGLPEPVINTHVEGERVDFFWPDLNLIVEVDGYAAHSDPEQFAEDRRRDREIHIATGAVTLRFTYDDCLDAPERVAADVAAAIARRVA